MNGTIARRAQLRNLAQHMTNARLAMAEQAVEREAAIRRDGVAHPRTIRASRRLTQTQIAYRSLLEQHRARSHEVARSERAAGRGI